jgi:thiol-disulfide isomerase/thioredoxin
MVAVPSTMLELGTKAPDFCLKDTVSGKEVKLSDFPNAKAYWIMFICNHCPFVVHIRHKLAEVAKRYHDKNICIIAISSNDVQYYPDDGPQRMHEEAKRVGYVFPYLYDEMQEVAKAYRAACTPDFYIFDKDQRLVYRGQFDDSRPGNNKPVTGADVAKVLDDLLEGKTISQSDQKPSIGCNIKWRKGQEPQYFKG